jgi:undecaprenyl diphosphate synthase
MDGNGRWAQAHGLSRSEGHRHGAGTVEKIVRDARDLGIKFLTLYAFSTENWRRPKSEVLTLMRYLLEFLNTRENQMLSDGVRLLAIGQISRLPSSVQKALARVIENTSSCPQITLVLALSYGGRDEIIRAVQRAASLVSKHKLKIKGITESGFHEFLDTRGIPDPDIIIRTAGEQRLSNFLLWQSAYAEFYYTPVLWPDFDREDLMSAVAEYQRRERRYGGLSKRETR